MPNLKNIFRYIEHYGLKSTFGLVREKLIVDPKRFSADKKRTLPKFPSGYKRAELPEKNAGGESLSLTVMYLIHYFYPKKKGGTERFTLNLATEQKKMGNRPIVLVLEANEPADIYTHSFGENILYRSYEYEGIECIAFRHKKAPLGLYYKSVNVSDVDMRAFANYITEKYSVDIVHATYPQPFSSFLAACKESELPYIVTCTDFCMTCHYSTMVDNNGDFCVSSDGGVRCSEICKTYGCRDFAERKKNARDLLLGARLVTVPSEFVANILGSEFPEVAFIPVAHGISDAFGFSARSGKVRKFVYAGTLSPLKGVHILIDAFNSLEGDGLQLDIYGEGDETYVSNLRERAGAAVKLHGAVPGDKMPEIYSAADCVIVPSMWYETYNFVLREAIMTGALGLAANIGAMPEAVDEGENGFLFAPSDKDSLEEAMKKALSFDFASYRRREYPSLKDEADIYYAVYRSAVQK